MSRAEKIFKCSKLLFDRSVPGSLLEPDGTDPGDLTVGLSDAEIGKTRSLISGAQGSLVFKRKFALWNSPISRPSSGLRRFPI